VVGDVRLAGERDGDDILSLVIVKRLKDEGVEVFDVDWSSSGFAAGGLSGTFGQGVSSRTKARRDSLPAAQAGAIGDTSWGLAHVWR
jgi:hypothetical protein